tara:strand:- start:6967 stop:7284 length:318 start_codon:yes stop_codon:yes gene_type:complete
MDIIKLLPEYLDTGVEDEELVQLARWALQRQIQGLKESIAIQVINARSATLLDDLDGSSKALSRARLLKKQYHHFLAELTRLDKDSELTTNSERNGKQESSVDVA